MSSRKETEMANTHSRCLLLEALILAQLSSTTSGREDRVDPPAPHVGLHSRDCILVNGLIFYSNCQQCQFRCYDRVFMYQIGLVCQRIDVCANVCMFLCVFSLLRTNFMLINKKLVSSPPDSRNLIEIRPQLKPTLTQMYRQIQQVTDTDKETDTQTDN